MLNRAPIWNEHPIYIRIPDAQDFDDSVLTSRPSPEKQHDNGTLAQPSDASRAEARRAQIRAAAAACFRQHGFHGTSIAQISKAAGMSTGHIYHYFENKEAIIADIVAQDLERLLTLTAELRAASDVKAAMIERAVEGVLEQPRPEHRRPATGNRRRSRAQSPYRRHRARRRPPVPRQPRRNPPRPATGRRPPGQRGHARWHGGSDFCNVRGLADSRHPQSRHRSGWGGANVPAHGP